MTLRIAVTSVKLAVNVSKQAEDFGEDKADWVNLVLAIHCTEKE